MSEFDENQHIFARWFIGMCLIAIGGALSLYEIYDLLDPNDSILADGVPEPIMWTRISIATVPVIVLVVGLRLLTHSRVAFHRQLKEWMSKANNDT